jgi:hypothetical protein
MLLSLDREVAAEFARETVARTEVIELTAFTEGGPGLRSILADAGVTNLPNPRLASHRHAVPAREASGDRIIDRRATPIVARLPLAKAA